MYNFENMPSYQRLRQRLSKIRPENRAILNTLSLDADFADDITRRALGTMATKLNYDYVNKGLGLQKEAFDYDQRQDALSNMIGLGNVASSTHFGLERDKIDNEILRRKLAFMKRI